MNAHRTGRRLVAASALALLAAAFGTAAASAAWWQPGRSPVPPLPIERTQSSADVAQQSMRIDRLEEQMRQLNGRLDEIGHQMQQIQELLRQSREDTDYRLQELEGGARPQKRSDAPMAPAAPAPSGGTGTISTISPDAPADLAGGFSVDAPMDGPMDGPLNGEVQYGAPPTSLGTVPADSGAAGPLDLSAIARGDETWGAGDPLIPVDPQGLPPADIGVLPPLDGSIQSGTLPPPDGQQQQQQQMASLSVESDDPRAIYDKAYSQVVAGDYQGAETGFRRYLAIDSSSDLAGDANYWLGESLLARGEFRDAADAFLSTYRDHPGSRKAPESLLKLGLSLEGLGEGDAACATYRELEKKYPDAAGAVLKQVTEQKSAAGC